MSTVITEKVRPHVTVISLNRPERLNAMSIDLCLDLKRALEEVSRDNDTRVVILTGAGRAFCSGLDLKDHSLIPDIDGLTIPRIGPRAIRIYSRVVPIMRHLPQPIIAAVNGAAYGGGMCLSLAADLRLSGRRLQATGIVNGLTSPARCQLALAAADRRGALQRHAATGRRVDAASPAHGPGSRVVPDDSVLDTALEMAEAMCAFSPYGVEMTKQVLWANLESSSLDAAIEIEDRNQIMLGMTDNLPEAITAFDQKRKPVYTDEPRRGVYPRE
jgi:enoyl-CoA hydratase